MTNDLLDRARDFVTEIDRSVEANAEAPVDPALVASLHDAGLYGAMIPRDLGGSELSIVDALDVFTELSRADGSVGWCVMASNSAAAYFGAWCDDDFASEVFGGGIPIVAGQFAPMGTMTPDGDAGWKLSGNYQFGSGMADAAWAGAGAFTQPADGENPDYRFVLMPKANVEIKHNWHVMGLKSTASWDYSINNVHVPDNSTFSFFFPNRYRGGTMYDMGVLPLTAAGHAAWAIGLTRRALDELRVIASKKQRMAGKSAMRDSEHVLMKLGYLEARARAAKTWTYDSFARLEAQVADGQGADEALVRDTRMATTFVNQEGGDIIREAYLLAGTTGLRDGGMQRAFRDIHAGTQHAVVSESVTYEYGQASLANAPDTAI